MVQLHLEHRLVKRLLSRFLSQGFRTTVGRITAIISSGAQPRVVLLGRLCLFGPGARRLHEEIIPVTAAWRDTRRDDSPLAAFAEAGEATTIQQLDSALRDGISPGAGVLERLTLTVERDVADLRPHVEARAKASERGVIADLAENGRREVGGNGGVAAAADRQGSEGDTQQAAAEAAEQLDFFGPTEDEIRQQNEREMRQFEADRRSWDGKLLRLQQELDTEPEKVRRGYEVLARRLEPIGLVYLWPATN